MTINIVDDHTPWVKGSVPQPLDECERSFLSSPNCKMIEHYHTRSESIWSDVLVCRHSLHARWNRLSTHRVLQRLLESEHGLHAYQRHHAVSLICWCQWSQFCWTWLFGVLSVSQNVTWSVGISGCWTSVWRTRQCHCSSGRCTQRRVWGTSGTRLWARVWRSQTTNKTRSRWGSTLLQIQIHRCRLWGEFGFNVQIVLCLFRWLSLRRILTCWAWLLSCQLSTVCSSFLPSKTVRE